MKHGVRLFLFTLLFVSLKATSQNNSISPNTPTRCYTVEEIKELRKKQTGMDSDEHFERWLKPLIQKRQLSASFRESNSTYTLPIIYHVIYWSADAVGSGTNVSKALLETQLFQLNKDFANLSNSPYAVAANAGIQFQLAGKNMQGINLTEPGIDRINASSMGWHASSFTPSFITNFIKPKTIWDPKKYINVWVIRMSAGILGYATFPSGSTLDGLEDTETDSTAGIVIAPSTIGSITFPNGGCNASAYNLGKTLTHEMGHFFGLRHIWGDASCGTDYCDDTPVHQSSNGGVPTHPKSNACGTPDEMFENFMDYTDDRLMNTFTTGQVSRMQTVLFNCPRRKELRASSAGLTNVLSNKAILSVDHSCINDIIVSEKGTTTSFPWYRDIPVTINIEDRATGDATVNIIAAGTASNNDFQILNPTVKFVAGDAFKIITVRVMDDAIPEGNETIHLTYSINGTGISYGTSNQSATITMIDDDQVYPGQRTVTLIAEDFEKADGAFPAGWTPFSTSDSPNWFIVSSNGDAGGSGRSAHITNDRILKTASYTKTHAASAALRTPLVDATGLTNLRWRFKYKAGGEINNGYKDYGWAGYATEAASGNFIPLPGTPLFASNTTITDTSDFILPETFNNTRFYLGYYWTNNNSAGTDPGFNIDDVMLTAEPVRIDTIANANNTWSIPVNTISNFKSIQNDQLIATIKNADNSISALTVNITEAGSDRPSITVGNTTIKRTRKVITLSPARIDNTTRYQATFYFTAEEAASWGTSISSLKILKVSDAADLSKSLTSADAVLINPTKIEDKLDTHGYIAFTGDFTGFGKFVLVEGYASLPLHWLNFNATLTEDKAKLKWTTSTENNNKGFYVERSSDGRNFTSIGWVNGLNGSINYYSMEDPGIIKGNAYYYRIKQVDKDNAYSYSSIQKLVVPYQDNPSYIFPNPFTNRLILEHRRSQIKGSIVITNAAGNVVYKSKTINSAKVDLSTSTWAPGMYLMQLIDKGKLSTFKALKQ